MSADASSLIVSMPSIIDYREETERGSYNAEFANLSWKRALYGKS